MPFALISELLGFNYFICKVCIVVCACPPGVTITGAFEVIAKLNCCFLAKFFVLILVTLIGLGGHTSTSIGGVEVSWITKFLPFLTYYKNVSISLFVIPLVLI